MFFKQKSEDFNLMEKFFYISAKNQYDTSVFTVALAGITYPDPTYKVYRESSEVYVAEYVSDGAGTVIYNGNEYQIKKGDAYILTAGKDLSDTQKEHLEKNGVFVGFNLFSVRGDKDDAEGINASNISISDTWSRSSPALCGPPVWMRPRRTAAISCI